MARSARERGRNSAADEWGLDEAPPPRRIVDDLGYADWVDMVLARARSREEDRRHVCARCFGDPGLKRFVRHVADARTCDFCRRRSPGPFAAPLIEVARFVEGCLRQDYDHPENVLFYDRESESGWAGTVWDNIELVEENVWADWDVVEALAGCLDPDFQWCEADPAVFMPEQHLRVSWETFCDYVKHTSRFMFLRPDEQGRWLSDEQDDTLVRSTEMLDLFGEAIEACNLIQTLSTSTRFYRARPVSEGNWFETADSLGPPPRSDTGPPASRMSPAGIPLLYAALDEVTALAETMARSGQASMGTFTPARSLKVLDLRADRPVPSPTIFENATSLARGLPAFVQAFRDEIARPVIRDGREHIDYVPSQIVTEFIRRVYRTADDQRLDGVLYPSTKNPDGACVALFVTNTEITGSTSRFHRDPVLRFRPRSPRRLMVRVGRNGAVRRFDDV
ncbi:HEPN-associated N-terminal domain-containing protein [Caulobacter rhizosphaerae]|jgi:hypothetical protein|uniref:HEPN-associated N-terminal domain-containing protein n=1 Tax=Caulobacter rhizosphaerae TaxID=2010972 RepID=UPI0013D502FC|nr:HEPN-associated N-terminal domain-containing protein [Caulobacter rhizosphaerae]GGL12856.1 hypothetical protein GCM10010983_07690 [Caulobacter rhizosphaerae]